MTAFAFPGDLELLADLTHASHIPRAALLALGMGEDEVNNLCFGDPTGSLASVCDVEIHEAPGEQMASDWTRDPRIDEDVVIFAQDGTGSMIGLWRGEAGADSDRSPSSFPVVFLGSEGMLAVMAPDLAAFAYLLACGNGTYNWACLMQDPAGPEGYLVARATPARLEVLHAELAAAFAPGVDAARASAALDAARALTPRFAQEIMATISG